MTLLQATTKPQFTGPLRDPTGFAIEAGEIAISRAHGVTYVSHFSLFELRTRLRFLLIALRESVVAVHNARAVQYSARFVRY